MFLNVRETEITYGAKYEQCYDKIPVHSLDTVMYVDSISRQTFELDNQRQCESNPQNVITLDPDIDW